MESAPEFGLVEPFEIDDGSLDGITPEFAKLLDGRWLRRLNGSMKGSLSEGMNRVCKERRSGVRKVGGLFSRRLGWNVTAAVLLSVTLASSATITLCPTNRTLQANFNCTATLNVLTNELETSDPTAV